MAANPLLPPEPAPVLPPLLVTPRQAAQALAVCEKTLWNLDRAGKLKAVRIGRAVRYSVSDLQAFIAQQGGVK
jgi:excisionase family DNA binding protein